MILRSARASAAAAILAATTLLLGCGPSQVNSDDDDTSHDGGMNIDGSSSGRDGAIADAYVPPPDAICGEQTEEIGVVNLGDPPDLLIVLDRSGSMILPPNFPPSGDTKWTIMTDALTTVTGAMDSNIRFGLEVFPTDSACGVSTTPAVPIDIDQGPEIASWMSGHSPDGNTPAHWALENALTIYNSIPVNDAGQFVLFATDGIPNCGGDLTAPDAGAGDSTTTETLAAITALHDAGINTYVLGFGAGLFLDPVFLNNAADAGGVPKPGSTHYYAAETASELEAVLNDIAGGIIVPSCSYSLDSPPPDPDAVMVTINGDAVPRSTLHTNGWDYYPDDNTITFFGSYCDLVMSGDIFNVSFLYGCPGPIVN